MPNINDEQYLELVSSKIKKEAQIVAYKDIIQLYEKGKRMYEGLLSKEQAQLYSICKELNKYGKQEGIPPTTHSIIFHFREEYRPLFYDMIREINHLLKEPFPEDEEEFRKQVDECHHLAFREDITKSLVHIAISKMFMKAGNKSRKMFMKSFCKEQFFALLADPVYCTGLGTKAAIKQGVNSTMKMTREKET